MNLDPLADKFYGLPPYKFVANSPVVLMDPDGKDITFTYDDHVFRIVNNVSKIPSANHNNPNTKALGFAESGHNFVYLDRTFTSRTAAHEIGHSAGLDYHIGTSNERIYNKTAYNFAFYSAKNGGGAIEMNNYFKNQAMKMATSKEYGNNVLPGNLMHQSMAMNSAGKSVAGYKVTYQQIQTILHKFSNGKLNSGKQRSN